MNFLMLKMIFLKNIELNLCIKCNNDYLMRKIFYKPKKSTLNIFSPRFGQQIDLNRENFTNSIDGENKNVTIIVHVYEQVCLFFLK